MIQRVERTPVGGENLSFLLQSIVQEYSPPHNSTQMSSSGEKWQISLLSALVFFVVAGPLAVMAVDALFQKLNRATPSGYYMLAIQAVIFMLVTRLMMY